MILTMERVVSPGWLTQTFESESTAEWFCYHRCVDCGLVVEGKLSVGRDVLLEHSTTAHKGRAFALELHRFRGAIGGLHTYYGLDAFQWPDKANP